MNIAGFTDKDEYKFLNDNEHLGDNIVLIGYGGSLAYGTNLPTSDTDIRGIATRTANDIYLGRDFEQVVNVNTDTTIYSIDKMFELLASCNPNCIEIVGLRPQDYLYVTEIGQAILDNKSIFLSNKCIHTFGGYARAQLYRLRQKGLNALSKEEFNEHITKVIKDMNDHLIREWGISSDQISVKNTDNGLVVDISDMKNISLEAFNGITSEIQNVIKTYNKNSARNEKALAHNKINKHAMHLLRLFIMGTELLLTGEVHTYREKEHDLLMKIRLGEYEVEKGTLSNEFWKILDEYETKFKEAQKMSVLPDKPDFAAIEKLKRDINRKIVMNDI